MAVFSKIVSVLITILFMASGVVSPALSQQVKPKDSENLLFSFATLSDSHLTEDGAARVNMLSQGLRDVDGKVDAIVHVGDMTDHGEREQYELFYDCVERSVEESVFIPTVGNHDTWTRELRDTKPTSEFLRAYNNYSSRNLKRPYYVTKVNGYTFITLSSEKDNTSAYLSNRQINWLDNQLQKASKKKGKPIFVICHWPINGVCGQMDIDPDMEMGEQSDRVQKVLEKYDNVFYFCGHVHAGFRGDLTKKILGTESIETINGVHYINLPSYMYFNFEGWSSKEGGDLFSGGGYIAEVYKDSVVLRARNYALGYYLPAYEKTIELV